MEALELVLRHERASELQLLRVRIKWLEEECRVNFHRWHYAKRRFEMLRDTVLPHGAEDRVTLWKTADGIHVMHRDSDIIGLL